MTNTMTSQNIDLSSRDTLYKIFYCIADAGQASGLDLRVSDHSSHPGASTKQKYNPTILLRVASLNPQKSSYFLILYEIRTKRIVIT
jgi:hypothetical protein